MSKTKNIAIIGASYLQLPLIQKAKEMGFTTHVFAWKVNDVGEKEADYFYPVSIVEKEIILSKCIEIGIDGICSISSDLAMLTVNYVAQKMGLLSNDLECTAKSTNKYMMRKCFEANGDPSPKSILVDSESLESINSLAFPVIVKPTDRSGSRGITLVRNKKDIKSAILTALEQSFEKKALVEEYVIGQEYSIECISFGGKHSFLQMTYKYTTGDPNYIETCHLEPAPVSEDLLSKVKMITFHALDSLGVKYGASHTELKIDKKGNIKLIEIGARMGGDLIGSHLVLYSTGFDFVKAVIEVSLGIDPSVKIEEQSFAMSRFIFDQKDKEILDSIKKDNPELLIDYNVTDSFEQNITDSSNRNGFFVLSGKKEDIYKYLPKTPSEKY